MIKRIKKITNVGRFRSCSSGPTEFSKITLIYGRNTYGKTTLGDIFSTIESHDTTAIKRRLSIPPAMPRTQEILLSVQEEGMPEAALHMQNGGWNNSLPGSLSIRVFDDEFYHKSIFSAQQITRETKENFSQFVIGEAGVSKAKEIASNKKEKGDLTRRISGLKKDAFERIDDLDAFILMLPAASYEEQEKQVIQLREEYKRLNDLFSKSKDIQSRNIPSLLAGPKSIRGPLYELNQCLMRSIMDVHESARERLNQHIQENLKDSPSITNWIKNGLAIKDGDNCPFCGQTLNGTAQDLLLAYQNVFDDSFNIQAKDLIEKLGVIEAEISSPYNPEILVTIADNNSIIGSYPELHGDDKFVACAKSLETIGNSIRDLVRKINDVLVSIREESLNAIKLKRESIHLQHEIVVYDEYSTLQVELEERVAEYNSAASVINDSLQEFKSNIEIPKLSAARDKSVSDGKLAALQLERTRLDSQCKDYSDALTKSHQLEVEIARLQAELETDQEQYLNTFFDEINKWFKKFGSSDFTLERGLAKGGHLPVYFLKVNYCGQSISEDNLSKVFSESDRRALALSVFWASISLTPEDSKPNTILVLDDPITSFDSHRVGLANQEILCASSLFRQIIVLSHYEQAITNFLTAHRANSDIRLIEIFKDGTTSQLRTADIDQFIKSIHERKREELYKFADGHTNACNDSDLRIFLEGELSYRFARDFYQNGNQNATLSEKIDFLYAHGLITDSVKVKAHSFREMTNPSHHMWQSSDIENIRSDVRNLLDFVYKELE